MKTLETKPEHHKPASEGWFNDPTGKHNQRFFDGDEWTEHVTHTGPLPCAGCRSD